MEKLPGKEKTAPNDSGSLRSLLEAQQQNERAGSFAETTSAILNSWASRMEKSDRREIAIEVKMFLPTITKVLKAIEGSDHFGEAVKHLKMERELFQMRAVFAKEMLHDDDTAARYVERVQAIDREIASVTDLLIARDSER